MVRKHEVGKLLRKVVIDLREYQPLLDLLEHEDIADTVQQIYRRHTLQETDFPVGVSIGYLPSGGESMGSASSADHVIQASCVVTLDWRQEIDNEPGVISETRIEEILSAVGDRASVGFGCSNPQGFVGGSGMLEVEEGAQWQTVWRWGINRVVFGEDGPRAD